MAEFSPDGQTVFTVRLGREVRPACFLRARRVRNRETLNWRAPRSSPCHHWRHGDVFDSRQVRSYIHVGTLARVPLSGGGPREILNDVQWADWSPDGKNLAVVRDIGGKNRLNIPSASCCTRPAARSDIHEFRRTATASPFSIIRLREMTVAPWPSSIPKARKRL